MYAPSSQRIAQCFAALSCASDSDDAGNSGYATTSESLSAQLARRRRQPSQKLDSTLLPMSPQKPTCRRKPVGALLKHLDDADARSEDASDATTDVASDGDCDAATRSTCSTASDGASSGGEGSSSSVASGSSRSSGSSSGKRCTTKKSSKSKHSLSQPVAWMSLGSRLAGAVRDTEDLGSDDDSSDTQVQLSCPQTRRETGDKVDVVAWQSLGARLFHSIQDWSDSEGDESDISCWRPKHHVDGDDLSRSTSPSTEGRETPPTRATSPSEGLCDAPCAIDVDPGGTVAT